jgi:hypothetical protein
VVDDSELAYFFIHEEAPIGLAYHESLEALAEFAKTCRIYNLIQDPLRAYIEKFRQNEEDVSFQYYDIRQLSHALPKTMQLRITKCFNDRDGFFVIMYSERRSILYLVAAIGVCADEGKKIFIGHRRFVNIRYRQHLS